jgi:hypothetical protein
MPLLLRVLRPWVTAFAPSANADFNCYMKLSGMSFFFIAVVMLGGYDGDICLRIVHSEISDFDEVASIFAKEL